ncbi:membrane hypothetical protein [Desulfamplus magnetovallimortis]|uniref:Uncharacterized protein n=1 Tax=Desulfamplus magnetovallimortis TaxID=1246637 RepID=A0A1W1H5W1_9BACT|nr:hypothetical protein [Desulfamplus magnetovallimortis]SLM27826.1 membrane hypothetical protein [Desulfamplus magnetovallimortis]
MKPEKPEIITWNLLIKFWVFLLTVLFSGFLAKRHTLLEVGNYITLVNVVIYFGVSIYAAITFILALRNRMPVICATFPLFANILMLAMGIMDIIWFIESTEQVLISWLNLIWAGLEAAFGFYTMGTLYIINNFDAISSKRCKEQEENYKQGIDHFR